ncbi:hypothetical protein T265_06365 [Opisthorchis viverrini]|uniref:Uncharacterized protein n=1 Tax=Opisthorchis viverrini TaxID=6198 RepID=A0A074ZGP5_OPIVI|nr:hypothetical protein T265_06365 [Opisthorchis viverrini]KER26383.1 hypothetical protein T265_06365 [Opisthorchis viverrini]
MTWQRSIKAITSKISCVGHCRLPGWGPRDGPHQWLETFRALNGADASKLLPSTHSSYSTPPLDSPLYLTPPNIGERNWGSYNHCTTSTRQHRCFHKYGHAGRLGGTPYCLHTPVAQNSTTLPPDRPVPRLLVVLIRRPARMGFERDGSSGKSANLLTGRSEGPLFELEFSRLGSGNLALSKSSCLLRVAWQLGTESALQLDDIYIFAHEYLRFSE